MKIKRISKTRGKTSKGLNYVHIIEISEGKNG